MDKDNFNKNKKDIHKKEKESKSKKKNINDINDEDINNFDSNVVENEPIFFTIIKFLKSFKISYNSNINNVPIPAILITPKSIISYFVDGFTRNFEFALNSSNINDNLERLLYILKSLGSSLFHIPVHSKPLNPILGETLMGNFHVNLGNGIIEKDNYYCFEQISHHPPRLVGCVYNKKYNVKTTIDFTFNFYFMGTYIKIELVGDLYFKIGNELYHCTLPTLNGRFIRGFSEYAGQTTLSSRSNINSDKIVCRFIEKPLIGGEFDKVESYIFNSSNEKTHLLTGQWSKDIKMIDLKTKKSKLFYTRPEESSVVSRNEDTSLETDSNNVWKYVIDAHAQNNNKLKSSEKRKVEKHQRQLAEERKINNIEWKPKHFFKNKDNIWDLINY